MKTELLPCTAEGVARAAALLRAGELVAFPTETVYGLGAVATKERAARAIFTAKGRPSDNPLIVHVDSLAMARQFMDDEPTFFQLLTTHFWPGPLSLVVTHNQSLPNPVTTGLPTVALRLPNHATAQALITATGAPIAAPSANVSGKPSPTNAADVLEDMDGRIAAVFDGGPTPIGIESTVLDLTTSPPTLLRPGHITASQIEAVINTPIQLADHTATNAPKSPGMKYRHYAPKAIVVLIDSLADLAGYDPRTTLVLSNQIVDDRFTVLPLNAASLFAHFREADRQGMTTIIVNLDSQSDSSDVRDRVLKASTLN